MDPLSLVTSVITIIGAAGATVKGLKKLKSIRDAPSEIFSLVNEVSTFSLLLEAVKTYLDEELETSSFDRAAKFQTLGTQIAEAESLIKELNAVIDTYTANKNLRTAWNGPVSRIQAAKLARRFGKRLRQLRDNIQCTVTLLQKNSQERAFSSLFLKLDQICVSTTSGRETDGNDITADLAAEDAASGQDGATIKLPNFDTSTFGSDPKSATSDASTEFLVTAITGSQRCPRFCLCQCHRESVINTPLFLRNILGSWMLAFCGLFNFGTRSCDYHRCKKTVHSKFQFSYFFPTWMLARVLFLAGTWQDLSGPGVSLVIRMPRVVPDDSAIFHFIDIGDDISVKQLLLKGEGSPFDVSADGKSVLWRAVFGAANAGPNMLLPSRRNLVRLLTQEGADLDQRDLHGMHATEIAFVCAVISRSIQKHLDFGVSFPFEDYVDSLGPGFTPLHRVVTRISSGPASLDELLDMDDRDVLTLDARGRSALSWAVIASDNDAIGSLLRHGAAASIGIPDESGETPMSLAYYKGELDCIRRLWGEIGDESKPSINRTNKYGESPLWYAILSANKAALSHLVEQGVDLEGHFPGGATPLQTAACYGHEEIVDILIEAGADLEGQGADGRTAICATIYWGYGETGAKLDKIAKCLYLAGSSITWEEGFECFHHGTEKCYCVQMLQYLRKTPRCSPRTARKVS